VSLEQLRLVHPKKEKETTPIKRGKKGKRR
jgi:hypothetical protein